MYPSKTDIDIYFPPISIMDLKAQYHNDVFPKAQIQSTRQVNLSNVV